MKYKLINNKSFRPLVAIALALALSACVKPVDPGQDPGQGTATGDDASDKMPFKVTKTTVNDNGKAAKTVDLRYYEDMPHVAYISVADFQNMLVPRPRTTTATMWNIPTSRPSTPPA